MSRLTRTTHAYALVELIGVTGLALAVMGVLGTVAIDAVHLQRTAAEHGNRMAVMDAATRALRRDLAAAVGYQRCGDGVAMTLAGATNAETVRWVFEDGGARRVLESGDAREWRAVRLRHAWRIERGAAGDLLLIDFIEEPPPRMSGLPKRTYSTPFALPRAIDERLTEREESL